MFNFYLLRTYDTTNNNSAKRLKNLILRVYQMRNLTRLTVRSTKEKDK